MKVPSVQRREFLGLGALLMAALAGCWTALVAGLAGMRHHDSTVSFTPRLPPQLTRLAFTITLQARRLRVEVTATTATYTLLVGAPLDITHHGQPITISAGTPDVAPIPPAPAPGPTPTQPPGREPARRRRSSQPATTTPPTTDRAVNNPIR